MRTLISIFLLLVLALRTAMPILDYAVNYDYISTQLCENRARPELRCNGKCYVKKEILKFSENQNAKESKVQIKSIDVFVVNENSEFIADFSVQKKIENNFQNCFNLRVKPFDESIFHPPLS